MPGLHNGGEKSQETVGRLKKLRQVTPGGRRMGEGVREREAEDGEGRRQRCCQQNSQTASSMLTDVSVPITQAWAFWVFFFSYFM